MTCTSAQTNHISSLATPPQCDLLTELSYFSVVLFSFFIFFFKPCFTSEGLLSTPHTRGRPCLDISLNRAEENRPNISKVPLIILIHHKTPTLHFLQRPNFCLTDSFSSSRNVAQMSNYLARTEQDVRYEKLPVGGTVEDTAEMLVSSTTQLCHRDTKVEISHSALQRQKIEILEMSKKKLFQGILRNY